jgi:hypothetical protein
MSLLPGAEPARALFEGTPQRPRVTIALPPEASAAFAGRHGQSLPAGLAGAGTVVAAGRNAAALIGRQVTALSLRAGSFGEYVTVGPGEYAPLPEGVTPREGADAFCNPMTALAIVEAARLAGHGALIHTAAASNLGRMLVRICAEDRVPLVNVVRRQEQADLLRALGAEHVVNSGAPTFREDLRAAIAATGATIAFDAIGGGAMPGELLEAIEDVEAARMPFYSPYGSTTFKQVFIYGHLDRSPTVLHNARYGMLWELRNWAMTQTLAQAGPERAAQMLQRVLAGLTTTFASHYTREISLAQALDPAIMLAYSRMTTGEKYLINPSL